MRVFSLDSITIDMDDSFLTYNDIRLRFHRLSLSLSSDFSNKYRVNFKDMDEVHEKCVSVFESYVNVAFEEAIKILASYDVFTINIDSFFAKYMPNHITWAEDWDEIDEKYRDIVLTSQEIDEYRTARRESRGHWIGGGFGVGGAVKGWAQASAMNMAAGAAHGQSH